MIWAKCSWLNNRLETMTIILDNGEGNSSTLENLLADIRATEGCLSADRFFSRRCSSQLASFVWFIQLKGGNIKCAEYRSKGGQSFTVVEFFFFFFDFYPFLTVKAEYDSLITCSFLDQLLWFHHCDKIFKDLIFKENETSKKKKRWIWRKYSEVVTFVKLAQTFKYSAFDEYDDLGLAFLFINVAFVNIVDLL